MARQHWPNGDAIGRQFRMPNLRDEPPYSPAVAGVSGVTVLPIAVAVVACLAPASRAASIDPMEAVRHE